MVNIRHFQLELCIINILKQENVFQESWDGVQDFFCSSWSNNETVEWHLWSWSEWTAQPFPVVDGARLEYWPWCWDLKWSWKQRDPLWVPNASTITSVMSEGIILIKWLNCAEVEEYSIKYRRRTSKLQWHQTREDAPLIRFVQCKRNQMVSPCYRCTDFLDSSLTFQCSNDLGTSYNIISTAATPPIQGLHVTLAGWPWFPFLDDVSSSPWNWSSSCQILFSWSLKSSSL